MSKIDATTAAVGDLTVQDVYVVRVKPQNTWLVILTVSEDRQILQSDVGSLENDMPGNVHRPRCFRPYRGPSTVVALNGDATEAMDIDAAVGMSRVIPQNIVAWQHRQHITGIQITKSVCQGFPSCRAGKTRVLVRPLETDEAIDCPSKRAGRDQP